MEQPEAATAGRATTGAGQLHTPHETSYDSFTQHTDKPEGVVLAPIQTLSPPVSPDTFAYPSFRPVNATLDPPLYTEDTERDEHAQAPLFGSEIDIDIDSERKSQASSRHDSQRSDSPKHDTRQAPSPSTWRRSSLPNLSPPAKPHNLLAFLGPGASFIPLTPDSAMDYYNKRMEEVRVLAAYRRARLPSPTKSQVAPRHPEDNRQLRTLTQAAGVKKTRSPPKTVAKPRQPPRASTPPQDASPEQLALATAPAPTPASRRSRTPKVKSVNEFHNEAFPATEKKHKRAAPSKATAPKEDDLRWREIEDFSPPLESAEKPLQVTWQGTPLEIKDELDYDVLTGEEKKACTTLRLKPAQYFANKRRIFRGKVQALKEEKPFTRTGAQAHTNIDVNKASQLWLAFDRMGWFERKHFEKWL